MWWKEHVTENGTRFAVELFPARFREPDPKAFQDFAKIFGPAFRRYFLLRGLDPFEAEDLAVNLVGDIPMRVIDGKFETRTGGSFRAWTLTQMRNTAHDWWRKRHRSPDVIPMREDTAEPGTGTETDVDTEDTDVVVAVREAIASLPKQFREIVELRHLWGEQDYAGVAATLGITSGAARVRHSRAMAQLAEALSTDPRLKRVLYRAQLGA